MRQKIKRLFFLSAGMSTLLFACEPVFPLIQPALAASGLEKDSSSFLGSTSPTSKALAAPLASPMQTRPPTAFMRRLKSEMPELRQLAAPSLTITAPSTNASHTLDGTAYMAYATYAYEWGTMELSQDYDPIQWLQQNAQGSPVIVEANLRSLYRWGSRFSIYTGLPGVVGWEWHQQQQRAVNPGTWITQRIMEVDEFYQTTDLKRAVDFLRKYDVRYILVGQQERGHYPGPGMDKFEAADGSLWREVYCYGETVIYQVLEN